MDKLRRRMAQLLFPQRRMPQLLFAADFYSFMQAILDKHFRQDDMLQIYIREGVRK